MSHDKFRCYLVDLGVLLKEEALTAKKSADNSTGTPTDSFDQGYLMAYYAVIDLMKQQAAVFDIKQKDIGLEDIEPERDLL